MRPSTLAEARRRAQASEDFELVLGDFLQAYYLAPNVDARVPMLADEPPSFQGFLCAPAGAPAL